MKNDLESTIRQCLMLLGVEETDSTRDTPARVARMWLTETFKGLNPKLKPAISVFENDRGYDEMVLVKDIALYSTCEHHLVPFIGTCSIGYLPGKKLLGLSKFNRLVDWIASKPTLQERLTFEIHSELKEILLTEDVAVSLRATHYCVKMRGIRDQASETITNCLTGRFRLPEVRQEFLSSIR